MKIDEIIRKELNLELCDDLSIYKTMENRVKYTEKITKIVNDRVPKLDSTFDLNILQTVKNEGYCVVENFISQETINKITEFTYDLKGYQFHVPTRAYNQIPEKFTDNLSWNVCSYRMNQIFKNKQILDLMLNPEVVSLAQKYIGCLPTITAVNLWWSKYNGETFHTQNIHRDYDDFRFIAFFIYLSDVDDDNGPHVYYKKTHEGSDDMSEKVVVKGKAGTAIFGDTYALHHGQPLNAGKRLIFWTRYALHKNNNFFRNNDGENIVKPNVFFDVVDDNIYNRHLLNAYIE
jgi:hypothetical protein